MPRANDLRYAQLSDEQLKQIQQKAKNVVVTPELGSYIGPEGNLPFFEKALASMRTSLSGLACADEFISAFVLWCNGPSRKAKLIFEQLRSKIHNGWVKFLHARGFQNLRTGEITRSTTEDFIKYLKKERGVSHETQRGYWSAFRSLLEVMKENSGLRNRLSADLSWQQKPFRRGDSSPNPTEGVDAVTLRALLVACRNEAAETIAEFHYLRSIVAGDTPHPPDETRDDRGRYSTIESAVWRLKELGIVPIPHLPKLEEIEKSLARAVQEFHSVRRVTLPFYPTAERLIPFIILHAIYTSGNTGPLLGMRLRQIRHKKVLGVKRIVFRFVKPRAKRQYSRSFAYQDDDILSPAKLHTFMLEWTSMIRPHAGVFSGNLFLLVTVRGTIRGFLTGAQVGIAFDGAWQHGLDQFLKRHSLPKINISNLRTTGLDIVRMLSGDDLRAVQAAGGQGSAQILQDHYEGDPARNRRNEALSEVMTTMEGWVFSEGKIDPRGTPTYIDILAATPGWHCADPFDSPIPGEIAGRRCQAFGRCPSCSLGALSKFSAYSLARTLQLLNEVIEARTYLDARRWSAAYKEVQIAIQKKWIPSFNDKSVWDEAAKLSLNPIGRLE